MEDRQKKHRSDPQTHNERYPVVRQPTLGEDTQKLEVYSTVADGLGISLEECYRGMYANLEENKRLVRIGTRTAEQYAGENGTSTLTTALTGSSARDYEHTDLTVDWLLTRYNLALAQAVLYDATEMRITVWDHFGTVFRYVKLFGLMHRIYPIDPEGERVASTDLEGSALLIRIQHIGWESGRLHTLPCGRELGPALT